MPASHSYKTHMYASDLWSWLLQVLQNCSRAMEAAREELLQEVAKIAAKPMNRYSTDLPGQQEAKNAAFALLRQYGREGQEVLRNATGAGQ